MSTVTVVIHWQDQKRSEWRHTVTPEVAELMLAALERGDEWLAVESTDQMRIGTSIYDNVHTKTKVRSNEILGISVYTRDRTRETGRY